MAARCGSTCAPNSRPRITARPTPVLTRPTMPKRTRVHRFCRCGPTPPNSGMGEGIVLCAHRDGGHEALQRAERLERPGEAAGEGGLHPAEAGLALLPHEVAGREQHRVLVERAGGDDVAGYRVDRVVLEDDGRPAGLQKRLQV